MTTETYTPAYRGTFKNLTADQDAANRWFEAKMLEALRAEPNVTPAEIEEVERGLRSNERRGQPYEAEIAREKGSYGFYGFYGRGSEHADYRYVWYVRAKAGNSYGSTRITVRKDGSLNMESLGYAASLWAHRQITERKQRDTFGANWAAYEAAGKPGEGHPCVRVELSRGTEGMAKVSWSGHGLQCVKSVEIGRISDLVYHLESVVSDLKAFD